MLKKLAPTDIHQHLWILKSGCEHSGVVQVVHFINDTIIAAVKQCNEIVGYLHVCNMEALVHC